MEYNSICKIHDMSIELFCKEPQCQAKSRFGCYKCLAFGAHQQHLCVGISDLQNDVLQYQVQNNDRKPSNQELAAYQQCIKLIEQHFKEQRICFDKFLIDFELQIKDYINQLNPENVKQIMYSIDIQRLFDVQDIQTQNMIFQCLYGQKKSEQELSTQPKQIINDQSVLNLNRCLIQLQQQTNEYLKQMNKILNEELYKLFKNQVDYEFNLDIFGGTIKCQHDFNWITYSIQELGPEQLLVSASKAQLNIFDVKQSKVIQQIDQDFESECNFVLKVNDKKMVSCYDKPDCQLKIWDFSNFALLKELKGHNDSIIKLLKVTDSQVLSGSVDKTVILWDIDLYQLLYQFKGHSQGIYRAMDVMSQNIFITGTDDQTIRIWSIQQHKCLKVIQHENQQCSSLMKWDESQFLSGGDGILIKWDVNNGQQIGQKSVQVKQLISQIVKLNSKLFVIGFYDYGQIQFIDYQTFCIKRQISVVSDSINQIVKLHNNQLGITSSDNYIYIIQ